MRSIKRTFKLCAKLNQNKGSNNFEINPCNPQPIKAFESRWLLLLAVAALRSLICATRLPAGSFSGDKLRMSWQQGNCASSANYSTRSYNLGQLWIWLNMAMVGTNNTIQHDKRYHNVWHTVLSRLWPPRRPHVLWRKGCGNATDNECLRGSTWPYVSLTQPPYFPASPSIGLDLADADLSCARCNTLGIILTSQVRTVLQQDVWIGGSCELQKMLATKTSLKLAYGQSLYM